MGRGSTCSGQGYTCLVSAAACLHRHPGHAAPSLHHTLTNALVTLPNLQCRRRWPPPWAASCARLWRRRRRASGRRRWPREAELATHAMLSWRSMRPLQLSWPTLRGTVTPSNTDQPSRQLTSAVFSVWPGSQAFTHSCAADGRRVLRYVPARPAPIERIVLCFDPQFFFRRRYANMLSAPEHSRGGRMGVQRQAGCAQVHIV